MKALPLKFETRVTGIEEEFSSISVRNANYDPQLAPHSTQHKYYTFEQRSRGWFIVLAELGIRIRVGDTKPEGINKNSYVEIIIYPVGEPTECAESSSNHHTPPDEASRSSKISNTQNAASESGF